MLTYRTGANTALLDIYQNSVSVREKLFSSFTFSKIHTLQIAEKWVAVAMGMLGRQESTPL